MTLQSFEFLTLQGPGVCLYGICNDLYKPRQVLKHYSLVYDIESISEPQPIKKRNGK